MKTAVGALLGIAAVLAVLQQTRSRGGVSFASVAGPVQAAAPCANLTGVGSVLDGESASLPPPPPPLRTEASEAGQPCRQLGSCGMADMQLAYEKHFFALQRCRSFSSKSNNQLFELPERLNYTSLDVAAFPALLKGYDVLEDKLMLCLDVLRDFGHMEKVLDVLHYPTALLKVPENLGEYEFLRSGKKTGRAEQFVHATWRTTCISPYHNHLRSWAKADPDQQIVFWTDNAIQQLIDTHFPRSKFTIFMRRVRKFSQNFHGVMIADLFRALLVMVFGGVYADTDIEVTRPWEHVFNDYDVLGAHERVGNTSNQAHDENWKDGMRPFFGGSFIMMAKRPSLEYWVFYVNQALDVLNHKSNGNLAGCHPVQCTGPRQTADRYYDYIAAHPADEIKRMGLLDIEKEFFTVTGMKHNGHCSWCPGGKKEAGSRFDIRANVAPGGLIFAPGVQRDNACPYEPGMVAHFDPYDEQWGKSGIKAAVLVFNKTVKESPIQHPKLPEDPKAPKPKGNVASTAKQISAAKKGPVHRNKLGNKMKTNIKR